MKVRAMCSALIFVGGITAAQASQNGRATATGTCSVAHSGNYDTIKIKNCGIGEEQGEKIISLLKEVLSEGNQQEINSKLDQILKLLKEGQGRTLTDAQVKSISDYLMAASPDNFQGIITYGGERESFLYGNEFKRAFSDKHWPSNFIDIGASTSPPFGVSVEINPADSSAPPPGAANMLAFLRSIGIDCNGQVNGLVPKGKYAIEIGIKPASR